jgi:hypothetical protein
MIFNFNLKEETVQHEQILALTTSTSHNTRLEVALNQGPDKEPSIELRRLSWGRGVGWYRQQTLQIDAAEAEQLLMALKGTLRQCRSRSATPHAKVLQFPHMPRHSQAAEHEAV